MNMVNTFFQLLQGYWATRPIGKKRLLPRQHRVLDPLNITNADKNRQVGHVSLTTFFNSGGTKACLSDMINHGKHV